MAPKVLLVLGVLMVALLFISSEVTASESAETTAEEEQTKDAVEDQYRRCYRCRYRCCGWWNRGCCRQCCPSPSEAADAVVEGADDAVADQYGRGSYRCPPRMYCCGGMYYGRCRRCCYRKDEASEVETEAKPHN